jgi:hypothetical protein
VTGELDELRLLKLVDRILKLLGSGVSSVFEGLRAVPARRTILEKKR